jgi:LysR family glycine cleavage system transcriptional activator
MSRSLPPLNALRAFEAAARHLSFTKAAEELNVTQAAISHQVKALEETLAVQLFRRLNRRLILTDAGQGYLPPLREALDSIAAATRRLRAHDQAGPLRVSVLNSFAAKWLLPRLSRFRDRHPEIDVVVAASGTLTDFGQEDVDMGIRYGLGRYPDNLRIDLLMRDSVYPVCSPNLLEGPHPLLVPEDLRHHTLLHDTVSGSDDSPDWRFWLKRAGVDGVNPDRGPGYSDSGMVLAAAIAGQGVALGRSSLSDDDVAAGLLVKPFGPTLATRHAYYLASPEVIADRPKIRLFRDWLLEEAGARPPSSN